MTSVPKLVTFDMCPVEWMGLGTCLCEIYKYTKQTDLEFKPWKADISYTEGNWARGLQVSHIAIF